MKRIKVIKRADAAAVSSAAKTNADNTAAALRRANETRREAAKVVANWIGELRERKSEDAKIVFAKLFRADSTDCAAS